MGRPGPANLGKPGSRTNSHPIAQPAAIITVALGFPAHVTHPYPPPKATAWPWRCDFTGTSEELREKTAGMEKKGIKAHAKQGQEARKDRKSGTGMSGAPKKGGHGGKFTWSGDQRYAGEEDGGMMEKGALDARDPNFEDPEEHQGAAVEPEGVQEHNKGA
ncbi:hypothetical protein Taro_011180 [Colocasia esculenta]|uniref:Uncharacterized protein n=1 Tax=Colocasia esculenta TaxID=4460 RepID=A0A843U582_COLES|nr:hypothetical protein [Colocasia esculenta]